MDDHLGYADWKKIQPELPWGILLVMGSGMALSSAFKHSKLNDLISDSLMEFVSGWTQLHKCLFVVGAIMFATQVC